MNTYSIKSDIISKINTYLSLNDKFAIKNITVFIPETGAIRIKLEYANGEFFEKEPKKTVYKDKLDKITVQSTIKSLIDRAKVTNYSYFGLEVIEYKKHQKNLYYTRKGPTSADLYYNFGEQKPTAEIRFSIIQKIGYILKTKQVSLEYDNQNGNQINIYKLTYIDDNKQEHTIHVAKYRNTYSIAETITNDNINSFKFDKEIEITQPETQVISYTHYGNTKIPRIAFALLEQHYKTTQK